MEITRQSRHFESFPKTACAGDFTTSRIRYALPNSQPVTVLCFWFITRLDAHRSEFPFYSFPSYTTIGRSPRASSVVFCKFQNERGTLANKRHNIHLFTFLFQPNQIVPIIFKNGFFYAICDKRSWTPRLETYYIINYLFKYWELADTLFLVVKKKPLGAFLSFQLETRPGTCSHFVVEEADLNALFPLLACHLFYFVSCNELIAFLHVYHHSATAVLCYTQLHGAISSCSPSFTSFTS